MPAGIWNPRFVIKFLLVPAAVLVILVAVVLMRMAAFDLPDGAEQRTLNFSHGNDKLQGTLFLPAGKTFPPVVLLVHGDAAQDRWSDGGYLPLVNVLLSQGIAVFSWDKPGVGASSGNWLAQTMADRADEAALALEYVKGQPELEQSRAGFLGFSQAGWVVPRASALSHADFVVLAGAAINWRSQGLYFMRQRLKSEGLSADAIAQIERREAAAFDRQYVPENVATACLARCTRQDFERRNALADASEDIRHMTTAVMLLMGDRDRNVDPHESIARWRNAFPSQTRQCLRLVSGATHGLLRSAWFDYQLPSQWPWWKKGAFLMAGKDAYAPGVLADITRWVKEEACL